jgi:drug/metabolite transporter (DMT)-like permease
MLIGALGLFALLDSNSKLLAGSYGVTQVLLIRFATLLALLGGLRLLRPGLGGPLGTRFPRLHLLRAAGMLGSGLGFFLALRDIPLAEGYLVYFTAPFMMLAVGALLLGEPVRRAVWGWSLLGFGGIALAMMPNLLRPEAGGGPWLAYLLALLGTGCYALVLTVNRQLRHESGAARLILWSSLPGLLVLAPFAALDWVMPDLPDLLSLMVNGVLAGLATLAIADAFRQAPIARLAPLEFSALIWAVLLDWLVWGVWPAEATLLGALVVVAALVMSQRAARARG